MSAYSSGAKGMDILIAAGIGAGSGIVAATINPVSYIGSIASGASLSMAGNIATQFATGNAFSLNSVLMAGISGAIGGAAGTFAGNAAFWATPVIGSPAGVSQAITNSFLTSTFVGAGVGLGVESGAQVCK